MDDMERATCSEDINYNLKEILFELQKQQVDITSLKQQVSLPVSSKQDHNDIKWKYEGNKQQYDFNCDVHEGIQQCMWAIENQKSDYAKEVLSEVAKKIHTRNKHIRIAETSEAGGKLSNSMNRTPSRVTLMTSRASIGRILKL
ncbi:hypothetical protein DPMN_126536 [Dreissena polymorpha]|uniref:Uncharacterized protein n=1 Tax=Dreissena polymorpha TaxID=45954 RepID=A0A9D4GVW6_DREPO|nr:hypothetical protein DPMN_126536 [Dreissena polymorpha]